MNESDIGQFRKFDKRLNNLNKKIDEYHYETAWKNNISHIHAYMAFAVSFLAIAISYTLVFYNIITLILYGMFSYIIFFIFVVFALIEYYRTKKMKEKSEQKRQEKCNKFGKWAFPNNKLKAKELSDKLFKEW